jgi:hypothetical protein
MSKESIIQKTIGILNRLPEERIIEIADFAEYIINKPERGIMKKEIEKLMEGSQAFHFLNDEECLYTLKDIKEEY